MSLRSKEKTSIQFRFTSLFILVIVGLLLLMMLSNSFFLERAYTKDKTRMLEQVYTAMDRMIQEVNAEGKDIHSLFPREDQSSHFVIREQTAATKFLDRLTEENNIRVVILDTASDNSYTTSANTDFLTNRLSQYILGNRQEFRGQILKRFQNYSIEFNQDDRGDSGYLESWGYFSDNSTAFLMSMPVASIKNSVSFFNHFLLLIGSFVLVIGSVLICFATRSITRPINELAGISEKMSKLDFSARYQGKSEDEIGILGRAMNTMSERLEESIQELKNANNELQSDVENKTLIDRRRQEFVTNVSHELKTPIALIQGYAEGLLDGLAEDPESRDYYCAVIVDESKKMNRMVRELMNLSAIEQGKDLPEITRFQLSRVVEGVVKSINLLIEKEEARLELDIPEKQLVWADEFKVEEVITNYLNNALNHLEEPRQISIYTEKLSKNCLALHVWNTGKRIPEEDIPHLWDKFYKVDKAHSRSYGGSGLGLSIVKAIADAHHQSCGVKNTRTGVDFWFTMELEEKHG